MKEWTLRILLAALALAFAAPALTAFLSPQALFDPIGIPLQGPDALAEIRAAYGGFFSVTAVLCALGAVHASMRGLVLGGLALLQGGFVLGRTLSWWIDGTATLPVSVSNFRLEGVALVLCLGLFWWNRRGGDGCEQTPPHAAQRDDPRSAQAR